MTLEIKINAYVDKGALKDQIDEAMQALGFYRTSTALTQPEPVVVPLTAVQQSVKDGTFAVRSASDESGQSSGFTAATTETAEEPAERMRGKASGGRARRTKDEIAEDEQLEKLAGAAGVPIEQVDNALYNGIPRATVVSELEAKVAKGNMGVDPENRTGPEDAPAVQEQDKADEQAEVETNREPEKPLTLDDVKAAMTAYVTKFQIAATQEDGPKIFADVLGAPPAGEPSWKLSLLASADQATLQKVIEAWIQAAGGSARYKAGA